MGLLQQIQAGLAPMPPRIMVYGTEGIGKSTIASRAPKPIFVQTEDGLGEIDCHKFPLARSLDDIHMPWPNCWPSRMTIRPSSSTASIGSSG